MKTIEELRAAVKEAAGVPLSEYQVDCLVDLLYRLVRDHLLGLDETTARTGLNKSALAMRLFRGTGPRPAGQMQYGRVWFEWDVEEWIREKLRPVSHNDPQEAS